MKTVIETESASVVLLSREAYDVLKAAQHGAALRALELGKMRDKFEARILKDIEKDKERGYAKFYEAADVLELFREVFEIAPPEPEPEPEPVPDVEVGAAEEGE